MDEKQNKATAFIVSVFIHVILLVFLFLFVLKTPIPPYGGGSGVVLNLGYVDEGSGEVQTLNEANDSPVNEENKPSEEKNLQTEPQPTEDRKESSDQPSEENLVTSDEENEIKSEPKPDTKTDRQDIKKDEKKNIQAQEEEKKKRVNPKALFGQNGESTKGGNNNGDKTGKVGDQGNPNGDINAKALYGNAGTGGEGNGGSGGASLDLAGWKWEKIPKVKDDNEDENGRIVFQITIDEQGEIISIKTLEKTVSPSVEKLYKQEVEKLSFVKTNNSIPPATSTGKITFIIRSR